MRRRTFLGTLLAGACAAPAVARADRPGAGLISTLEAQRHGMKRAWVTQVDLDRSRDRVKTLLLDGPTLFAQTDRGLIHAIDAETGGTLWSAQVGRRDQPCSAPAANEKHIAVCGGSLIYLVDRTNGRTIWEKKLVHTPSGSVALSTEWVYSPSVNGQMEVLSIEDNPRKWNNASFGQIDVPPLVARTNVVWGTDRGFIYFCSLDRSNINFRLDTLGAIAAPLGYWPPTVFAASRDGYLYAIDERNGEKKWRFSLGGAINDAPIAIEGSVYIMPQAGGMHSLNCADGSVQWFSPKVYDLLAVSAAHLYAADRFGDILVMDVKTGAQLDTMRTPQLPLKYTNVLTDRLYLGNTTGMLMCLHEAAQTHPVVHKLPDPPLPAGKTKQDGAAPPADAKPAEKDNVFGQ